jgi:hypothetical protein
MATPGLVDRAGRFKGTDHIYFYVMGSLMLDGRTEDLYSPEAHIAEGRRRIDSNLRLYQPHSNYGPQVALAFVPLARLSYASSLTVFLLFTAICYSLSVWIIWRDLPGLAPYGRLVALLAAASPLLFALLRYAQLSAITLLLLSLALAALRRNRRFLAGIVLGTLIFKPQLGLVLGIALVMAAEWQVVAGAAAAGLTQITLAWTVSSTSVMRHYVDVLWRLLRDPSLVQIYPTELHSLRGFLQLLFPHSPFVNFISLASTAALLAIAIRVWKGGSDIGVRWGTLVLLTILASPHLLTYDLLGSHPPRRPTPRSREGVPAVVVSRAIQRQPRPPVAGSDLGDRDRRAHVSGHLAWQGGRRERSCAAGVRGFAAGGLKPDRDRSFPSMKIRGADRSSCQASSNCQ